MKLSFKTTFRFSLILILGITACRDKNSIYNTDYEPERPDPVITSITPEIGYLSEVDSIIVTGENFSSVLDEVLIDFGGTPGIVHSATPTQLVVRPGSAYGEAVPVRVSVRNALYFSNTYNYKLEDPYASYPGLSEHIALSALAIDAEDNIYTILEKGGTVRYTKVSPDGILETDEVKYPGEPRPNPKDTRAYPTDSTMRYTSYSSMKIGPENKLYMTQASVRAIFVKTFGDNFREAVWSSSSNRSAKFFDILFDNNGYLWAVGSGSDNIHRFSTTDKSETLFPFMGNLTAVALYNNSLYVGGSQDGENVSIWKFDIDGSGNLINETLYFDFTSNYDGTIKSMMFSSTGELFVATTAAESIVQISGNGTHQPFYPDVLKSGSYSLTWRSDKFAIVAVSNADEDPSVNIINMYDKTRAPIFGF